jgi:hypothetical protein
VPFAILRPGPLSDVHPYNAIALADALTTHKPPVARADVAHIAVKCVTLGIRDRLVAFVGREAPTDIVLNALSRANTHAAPTSL